MELREIPSLKHKREIKKKRRDDAGIKRTANDPTFMPVGPAQRREGLVRRLRRTECDSHKFTAEIEKLYAPLSVMTAQIAVGCQVSLRRYKQQDPGLLELTSSDCSTQQPQNRHDFKGSYKPAKMEPLGAGHPMHIKKFK